MEEAIAQAEVGINTYNGVASRASEDQDLRERIRQLLN
ncbi:hypothetical protein BH24PSE2_BH24PSE2_02290 [soil metagenome]